jgi:hypothetical protein
MKVVSIPYQSQKSVEIFYEDIMEAALLHLKRELLSFNILGLYTRIQDKLKLSIHMYYVI